MLEDGREAVDRGTDHAGSTVAVEHVVVDERQPLRPEARPHRIENLRRRTSKSGPRHSVAAPVERANAGDQKSGWIERYRTILVAGDFAMAAIAAAVAYVVRFVLPFDAPRGLSYVAVSALVPFAWVAMIALNRGYDARYFGVGAAEFQRIYRAFVYLIAVVSFVAYATKTELARGFVIVALPGALLLGLLFRYSARKRLHLWRRRGLATSSVVITGTPSRVVGLAHAMRQDLSAGYSVVGACVPHAQDLTPADKQLLDDATVPILGEIDDIIDIVRSSGADAVAVTSSAELGPERLRWISWQLEGSGTELIVSPGLVEVAGTRLHVRPVSGLPLLRVEKPEFTGFRRFLKATFDRSVAAFGLIVLSPLLAVVAIAIRVTSRGPAFFLQTRVGRDGSTFQMFKFRSMSADAERLRVELVEANEKSDGLLFKIRKDPRVTRIGKVLRRYSIDELPQLINVLLGHMSLVGPRPPLPSEVSKYGEDVRRRLLVKPGLTGLWQVSGRSDLTWEESVRLDLRYVENWTLALDILVLWKTARAVLRASGAY